jgi:glycosyltransferase involved in cell wall biosynthesis
MQVDILHYAAPPVVGGVESVIAHHALLMADAGHDVRILAGRGEQFDERIPFISIPKADSRHPEIQSIKADLDKGEVPNPFFDVVSDLEQTFAELLKATQVLIAHNVCSLHKNLALTAALKLLSQSHTSPRLILWHHDLAWRAPRYRSELYEGYPWDLLRSEWIGATQVVVSVFRQRELAELTGLPIQDIQVIPNGLDIRQFLKLEAQSIEFVKQLDLFNAAPFLLLPVRITPRKNIELALRILAALRREYPAASLVITGPLGPHNPANVSYYDKLLEIRSDLDLEGAAHFLAEYSDQFLPDSVIGDFYRLADALLMPSREEGFGIPILEAGLSGIPIFCADIPTLRELGLEDVGYFSLEDAPSDIARMIGQSLSQDQTFRLGLRVRKNYSWERVYQDHIAPLLTG